MRALTALCGLLSGAAAAAPDADLMPMLAGLRPRNEDLGLGAVEQQLVSGKVKGRLTVSGVKKFLGVPYAEPPVGELRWQPPKAVKPWNGTKDADKYSKACVQLDNGYTKLAGYSEDCLYLNMWLPKKLPPAGEKYAVMIWIHGGSWKQGSAMWPLYNGEELVVTNKNTVVVSINYRLAALGFLGSDFLRATDGSTGNFGIQDQRLAMEWVRANADLLNIDLSKVMIFGESAGAGSVSNHLVRQRSRGLFTRATMQSGPFADWSSVTMQDAEKRFAVIASKLNCTLPAGGDPAKASAAEKAALQKCMRSKDVEQIRTAMTDLPPQNLKQAPTWEPVADGVDLTDQVQTLAKKGDIANVPVLFGTNANEGTGFIDIPTDSNQSTWNAWVDNEFPTYPNLEPLLEAVRAEYNTSDFNATKLATAQWWSGSGMIGDSEMTCAARRSARYLSVRGPSAPAFVYLDTHELDITPAAELVAKFPLGVFHGAEIPLVFGLDEVLGLTEKKLSKKVQLYWTNFAHFGDPNMGMDGPATLPHWPAYNSSTDLTLSLGLELDTIPNLKRERCDMWDRFAPYYPN